ncbi:MAG: glycine dehydrogenase (aminomethyl-transferring) [Candidatus Marinimicrobia bacterium]|nr:glycine dehydrogenase (aminomethyl-transferring) [Candidatus Neomarinimicrobiota bacterium]|tara:strand:- start:8526 stop:11351 length:2826 start_codon:yes stop_codon:yes gene_type:complete
MKKNSFTDNFQKRHIGLLSNDEKKILNFLGFNNLDDFINEVIPNSIKQRKKLIYPKNLSESKVIEKLDEYAKLNTTGKCYIGQGYYPCIIPQVILRNILENPSWYTAYTPYQSEISQGRLEALLNFQTMVSDLTGLPISNASLLDEGTAAAEAMNMFFRKSKNGSIFLVDSECHPQTIEIIKTRAEALSIKINVEHYSKFKFNNEVFGAIIQYPNSSGEIINYSDFINEAHKNNTFVCVASDLMALTLIKPPGEFNADVVIGNSQRFGVPLGYGGPHAAFFSTSNEFKRLIPGRIIGITKDKDGNNAFRMALQTREQHIRRDKATSNICTSQVLLAIMVSMYGVYHGPEGLKSIAETIASKTKFVHKILKKSGIEVLTSTFFDTIRFFPQNDWKLIAKEKNIFIREFNDNSVSVSLDETKDENDIINLLKCFGVQVKDVVLEKNNFNGHKRKSRFMQNDVFNFFHSETKLMRYIRKLDKKDFSLANGMIPLGSCTMKLNASSQLHSLRNPGFSNLHPFVDKKHSKGYKLMIDDLKKWLTDITGFNDISFQPNSGAQGEYAGLLVIRAYHKKNSQQNRKICLIPSSAHGTNPASAILAGMEVWVINCDNHGNIDKNDLIEKVKKANNDLAALMITYPSTHGVFENDMIEICKIIHENGGFVYLDGANMNAMVGLSKPGEIGVDVCHLNLHKTFAIPHGGGGPGMGPICVSKKLSPFLPKNLFEDNNNNKIGPISSSDYSSASILTIPWSYISMLGGSGLSKATKIAILNANYLAKKLSNHYKILYTAKNGLIAHEFIIDLRPFRKSADISEEDIAKRLIDYGFHAPTMSWPVVGTMMIEPTESEDINELNRFAESMISIRKEIKEIEDGICDKNNNLLKNAPHTALKLLEDNWNYSYSRKQAAFPLKNSNENKFWPSCSRVDNALGDRNLICTCLPVEMYKK